MEIIIRCPWAYARSSHVRIYNTPGFTVTIYKNYITDVSSFTQCVSVLNANIMEKR